MKSLGVVATKNSSRSPNCSARRSPAKPDRSATGRSHFRPDIRYSSARCCGLCAFPGKPDVLLNLGNRWGELASPGTKLISIRHDPASLARQAPVDLAMVADLALHALT